MSDEHRHHQIAALPVYVDPAGGLEVYLVTARGSGRWIIPKGNPIRGRAPHEVAAQEAIEEAGLVGRIGQHSIGAFEFSKGTGRIETAYLVDVYVLKVERQMRKWAEMKERSVLRCNIQTALTLITSHSLAALLDHYVSSEIAMPGQSDWVAS